jgi:hypothetical protein
MRIVDGERVWQELDQLINQLRDYYVHQLSIRQDNQNLLLPGHFPV